MIDEALPEQACAYCGERRYRVVVSYPEGTAVRCVQCRLVRSLPYPSFEYSDTIHYIEGDVHREHLFAGFAREFMTFIARYAPGPELVEIGSGLGLLLVEAQRRGFAARGLEVNTNQVALMRARGLHVVESTLEQAALPPGSVDVVCMSHVLEHIQEMHSLLCAVHRVLKPGGVLAVSQPHYAAPLPRLIGHLWLGWDWQRHVWHFDVPTLTRVLSTHGLMCLAVEYNAMYHSWVPHPFSWRPKVLAVEVLKAALSRAEPWLGYGDQFFLAARRDGMV